MKSVFVGAVDFSHHCLRELIGLGVDIELVCTLDLKFAHRHSDFADLGPLAEEAGIAVERVKNINEAGVVERIRGISPDVVFVLGWSQIVKPELLAIPKLGSLGSHPALLPRNRGRHPVIWALVEGLEESGLTFFWLEPGVDSGDIAWQRSFPISLDDDAASVMERLKVLASEGLTELVPELEAGRVPRRPQAEEAATYWRKRTVEDGEIDWQASSMSIYNLVRALTRPYPGAHTWRGDTRVQIWAVALPDGPTPAAVSELEPGQVTDSEGELCVRTGDGYLTLKRFEVNGGGSLASGASLGGRSEG